MSLDRQDTIFCKILRDEIPSDRVWEDEHCIGFRDINPAAPVHILVIPRKCMTGISSATEDDRVLLGHLLYAASRIAAQEGIAEDGYRIVINCNKDGGQVVYHLHIHILGGRQMSWPPG
jgi:histidine triad (HIT) family protein